MKNLLTVIPEMLFTLMFSPPSYAEWTKVSEDVDGNTFYVDFDRIRKVDGNVYYWGLTDYFKPNKVGFFLHELISKVIANYLGIRLCRGFITQNRWVKELV